MSVPIKHLVLSALMLVFAVLSVKADEPAFEPGKLYSIKNKVTQTSMLIGEPGQESNTGLEVRPGLGAAKLSKTTTGWQILSPCDGVVVCSDNFHLHVFEESDFEFQIESRGDYYVLTCNINYYGSKLSLWIQSSSDSESGEEWISAEPAGTADPEGILWEIIPLPDGAIVDVPGMVEDVNRTYKIGNDDFYAASAIELSETMGFACAHEVYADKLTYKRELKENWQGLCAPFRLDKAD